MFFVKAWNLKFYSILNLRTLDPPSALLEYLLESYWLPSSYWEQFLDTSDTETTGTKMINVKFLKLCQILGTETRSFFWLTQCLDMTDTANLMTHKCCTMWSIVILKFYKHIGVHFDTEQWNCDRGPKVLRTDLIFQYPTQFDSPTYVMYAQYDQISNNHH